MSTEAPTPEQLRTAFLAPDYRCGDIELLHEDTGGSTRDGMRSFKYTFKRDTDGTLWAALGWFWTGCNSFERACEACSIIRLNSQHGGHLASVALA